MDVLQKKVHLYTCFHLVLERKTAVKKVEFVTIFTIALWLLKSGCCFSFNIEEKKIEEILSQKILHLIPYQFLSYSADKLTGLGTYLELDLHLLWLIVSFHLGIEWHAGYFTTQAAYSDSVVIQHYHVSDTNLL